MEITCPKCHAPMRQYERSGIVIDQCTECRGVYLDRGELDKLIQFESGPAARPQTPQAPPPPAPGYAQQPQHGYAPPPPAYGQQHGYGYKHRGGYGYKHQHKRRHRGGFLGELFD